MLEPETVCYFGLSVAVQHQAHDLAFSRFERSERAGDGVARALGVAGCECLGHRVTIPVGRGCVENGLNFERTAVFVAEVSTRERDTETDWFDVAPFVRLLVETNGGNLHECDHGVMDPIRAILPEAVPRVPQVRVLLLCDDHDLVYLSMMAPLT